jgi:hypothetical protein
MADTWDEAACRARLAAVTSGPWVIGGLFPTGWRLDRGATPIGQRCHDFVGVFRRESDAVFSAYAAADLGAALAALDAARAECDRLGQVVCDFRAASLLEAGGGDPAGVTPAHVERHVTELRAECDRLRAALREAVEVAECHAGEELVELRRAAAALGGDSDG